MGEARRRGTYDERKAAAIARKLEDQRQYQGRKQTLIKVPKGPGAGQLLAAIAAGMLAGGRKAE